MGLLVTDKAQEVYIQHLKKHKNGVKGKHMRKHILVVMTALLVFAMATVSMAADPSIGTWKLNITKSKVISGKPGPAPKERTLVKRELNAEQLEATFTGTSADGSPTSSKSVFFKEGGAINFQQDTPNKAIMTVVGSGDCYVTYLQDGRQIRIEHWVISKDGKTMQDTVIGTSQGKPYETQLIWERQ